jgi:hypothetical protein
MGGSSGGGGGAPTTSVTNTSNLPEYARPYFEHLMGRAEQASNTENPLYQGERLAGPSADTQAGYQKVRDVAAYGMPENKFATDINTRAQGVGFDAGNYRSNAIQQDAFGQQQANQYMSPYMENVIGRQKDAALRDFNEGRAGRDTQAIQAGAFGGYRDAIQQGVAQRGLANRMNDIDASGRQQAYANAQQQFNADRAASMGAQTTTEQQRLAAAQYGLSGAGMAMQAGNNIAGYGVQRSDQDLKAANALQQQGGAQTNQYQKGLDIAYQDFINQRDYNKNNISYMSNILRGVPVQPTTVQNTYSNPNPLNSVAGLTIAGIGAARGV